ncbi:hypothetical protein TUM4438_25040 [Shewanella sairae]|uniref:DUF4124 domain-containing protein n=1 Tax=Shewanella sairae TaxID=190310 RepID=A0ABQ4PHT6_9GAMM|nr:DUF4124 domain-containing protein [Shewanella sairae]MCL1131339.1 DUF4124 domain-containing protein [Shewanella sairae]GIU47090.1 hypothetical protein TUM4438_25040 [Shewanella sairae]
MYRFFQFIIVIMMLQTSNAISQEVHQWIDESGVKHFSTNLPPISCKTESCTKINESLVQESNEHTSKLIAAKKAQHYISGSLEMTQKYINLLNIDLIIDGNLWYNIDFVLAALIDGIENGLLIRNDTIKVLGSSHQSLDYKISKSCAWKRNTKYIDNKNHRWAKVGKDFYSVYRKAWFASCRREIPFKLDDAKKDYNLIKKSKVEKEKIYEESRYSS